MANSQWYPLNLRLRYKMEDIVIFLPCIVFNCDDFLYFEWSKIALVTFEKKTMDMSCILISQSLKFFYRKCQSINRRWNFINQTWHSINRRWHFINRTWNFIDRTCRFINRTWNFINRTWHFINRTCHFINLRLLKIMPVQCL